MTAPSPGTAATAAATAATAAATAAAGAAAAGEPARPATLRVLTWNIWGLRGDPSALVRVIRAADADVVCLQEAPRWPGSRWELSALARRCGLLFVDGGRSAGGCALLASLRADVPSVCALRLPVSRRSDSPRGTVVAEVAPVGCEPIALAVVHLPLDARERLHHVALVRERLAVLHRPRILVAGDLNESPGGPVWAAWAQLCTDPFGPGGRGDAGPFTRGQLPGAGQTARPTFPAGAPRSRIDAVLAANLDVAEYDAWRADQTDVCRASDHRPVLAVFYVPRRRRDVTAAP